MSKIKITIECTASELRMANFILKQGCESAMDSEAFQYLWQVSRQEIIKAENFRLKLVEESLKS